MVVSEVQAAQAVAAAAAQVAAAWVWEEEEAEAKEEVVASSAHTRVVRAGSLGMVVTAVAVAWELAVAERAMRLVGVAERVGGGGGEGGGGAMASATEEASDPQKPAAAGAGAGGGVASRRQSTRREGSWACYARWRREQRWPGRQAVQFGSVLREHCDVNVVTRQGECRQQQRGSGAPWTCLRIVGNSRQ